MNLLKNILKIFTSMKFALLLLTIYAIAIIVATFIENDYGVTTSWALIYRARWFEILQALLIFSLVGGLLKYKSIQNKKIPILIFHFAFIVIFVGAAMTRYYGYEAMMGIREGETTNRMLSTDSFMQISVEKNGKEYYGEKLFFLTHLGKNNFEQTLNIDGEELKLTLDTFLNKAIKVVREVEDGNDIYELVISTPNTQKETLYLSKGKSLSLGYLTIYFDKKPKSDAPYIYIYTKNDKQYFVSNYDFNQMNVSTQSKSKIVAFEPKEYKEKYLVYASGFKMVSKKLHKNAQIKVVKKYREDASYAEIKKDYSTMSALIMDVEYNGKSKEVTLMGMGKGYQGQQEVFEIEDLKVTLSWGSKEMVLPFSLKLNDFLIEKYPGSKSPSSYESKVTLIDKQNNIIQENRIYMNNTLTHQGYTFFQSSYDKDEKGTILSVNYDPGKIPTYVGYFLLIFGLLLNLFSSKSRFVKLIKTKYISSQKIGLSLLFLPLLLASNTGLVASEGYAVPKVYTMSQEDIITYVQKIDKTHADKFGELLVQDNSGRIKPMNTLAIELVNKITGGKSLFGLTQNQIFVGMVTRPEYWQRLPLFKVKHTDVKKLFGLKKDEKKFSYVDAFSKDGQYKLYKAAEDALRKKPSQRGVYEKEIIKIDERLNVGYMIFEGEFFKSIPLYTDFNNKWFTVKYALHQFPEEEKKALQSILLKNFTGVNKGYDKGEWQSANEALEEIKTFQIRRGYKVIPSDYIIKAELLYNELKIFERLYPAYLFTGIVLLLLVFVKLIKTNFNLKIFKNIALSIFIVTFVMHTLNLGLRWYIAGHAPWSNSYEAMLYISWTIILAGILFARDSEFALSTTGVFSGITLFVAHLSWLDPQITTLVPVLKSYWLTIHVSVITASYGFLGLSAMLGFISLILYILLGISSNETTKCEIVTNIREAARINEISITIGLTMLIIGNFLGGIWANESWGRYWGWDPKESWTLISVVVYALVLHLRYVPKLNSPYVLSVATLVSYSAIIMTYFGVNYYLTGLHSYATGDHIPVPQWVYYSIGVIFLLVTISFKYRNILSQYSTKKQNKIGG